MTMRQKIKKTTPILELCIFAALAGIFTAGRLGALSAAAGRPVPVWLLWLALMTLFLAAVRLKSETMRQADILSGRLHIFIIAALSVIFCILFGSIIVDRPLSGTGILQGRLLYAANVAGAALLLTVFLTYLYNAGLAGIKRLKGFFTALTVKDLIFCLLLLAFINTAAWIYIKSSHTIYFWDNAGYWSQTQSLADTARAGILPLLRDVYESVLTQDYNALIILPWVPLVLIFGPSRWVFIAGIVNMALFPILVLLYAYVRGRSRRPVLAAACVICSFPMLFYASITGFVDVAGVFFTLSAVLLYLSSRGGGSPGRFFIVGCALALSVLLRRWFLFFALSFFVSLLIDGLVFRRRATPLVASAFSFCFSLLFLFQPLVAGKFLQNYASSYSAYALGLGVDVRYFFYYFGVYIVLIALLGAALLLVKKATRPQGVFLLAQPVVCFILFVQVQSHGQQHLLLYVPALLCLAAVPFCALADKYRARRTVAAFLVLAAFLPFISPFLHKTRPAAIQDIKTSAILPAFNYIPPYRPDADEIVRLVRYLDQNIGERDETVGILASSFVLNEDILLKAEASLGLRRISDVSRDYIAWLPEVDSRDDFPGSLFDCDYLLVADPIQLHLGLDNQQCVALPASQILSGTDFGSAFHPVGEQFTVGDGTVKVQLYEKYRALTDSEKSSLIEAYKALKA